MNFNFKVDGSNLIGSNPVIKVTEIQNGGAFFSPIKDDMLRTLHSKPQVIFLF